MTRQEYISVASEIKELETLLDGIPAERAINRMSLESRLKRARVAIRGFSPDALAEKAQLTFRGRPVVAAHGISADFGSKASNYFTEAFSAVVAGLSENLRYMGPIPDKQKHQLLITGTAVGSFGFEYELPAEPPGQTQLFPPVNRVKDAMSKLEKLFQAAAQGSDDEVTDLVDEIHPRAVKKVAEFLTYLAEQNAWCGLQFQDNIFRFSGADQVRESAARLTSSNIKEADEEYFGEFQGVLPKSRTFEFKLADQGAVLRGKVGPDVEDPDLLNREYLHKPVTVTFHMVQVGQARPRFTLEVIGRIKK